ncbi:MAG: relaxase domain-containing protein [Nocardioidaceae bacterium]
MTVHKLTAGDGYTYLTPPGRVGRRTPAAWPGANRLLRRARQRTEAQLRARFGDGCHSDRDRMLAEGATVAETKLALGYPTYGAGPPADTSGRAARKARRAVAGFDLVLTPVKSASLLWGLGGPAVRAQVEAAHHEAVQNTPARAGGGGVGALQLPIRGCLEPPPRGASST